MKHIETPIAETENNPIVIHEICGTQICKIIEIIIKKIKILSKLAFIIIIPFFQIYINQIL